MGFEYNTEFGIRNAFCLCSGGNVRGGRFWLDVSGGMVCDNGRYTVFDTEFSRPFELSRVENPWNDVDDMLLAATAVVALIIVDGVRTVVVFIGKVGVPVCVPGIGTTGLYCVWVSGIISWEAVFCWTGVLASWFPFGGLEALSIFWASSFLFAATKSINSNTSSAFCCAGISLY